MENSVNLNEMDLDENKKKYEEEILKILNKIEEINNRAKRDNRDNG